MDYLFGFQDGKKRKKRRLSQAARYNFLFSCSHCSVKGLGWLCLQGRWCESWSLPDKTFYSSLSPQSRAWNNFPAGAGQVVRSNLCLLGHNPFLAGQISITSHLYKMPAPAWCLHIKQVHFVHLYYTCSLELNAGKVERKVQPQRWAKSIPTKVMNVMKLKLAI